MSLSITQFQGPAMAATGEQSCCLKLTFVSLDLRTVRSSGQIAAEIEATQTLTMLELS